MSSSAVMDVFHEAIMVAIKLAAPMLIASILIGLIIAVFQAATQIHEQTLTFVPKVLIIALILLGMGSWMITTLSDFTAHLFQIMAGL